MQAVGQEIILWNLEGARLYIQGQVRVVRKTSVCTAFRQRAVKTKLKLKLKLSISLGVKLLPVINLKLICELQLAK